MAKATGPLRRRENHKTRINMALAYADLYLVSQDKSSAIHARPSDLPKVWET